MKKIVTGVLAAAVILAAGSFSAFAAGPGGGRACGGGICDYAGEVCHDSDGDGCRYFDEAGRPVGTATVYRNLEKLMEEGIVAKYSADPSDSACFSYIGSGEECCHPVCFHLKCQKCGHLVEAPRLKVEKNIKRVLREEKEG